MPETNLLKRIFSPAPTPTTTPVSKVPPAAASVPVTVAEPPKRSFWEVHRKLYDLFWGERHGMDEYTHKAFEAKLPKDGTRDAVRKKLINLKFFSDLFGSEPERVEPEMSALMSGMAETAWGVTGGVDDGKFFDLMKADVARQRRMLVSARTAGTLRFPTWRGFDLWKAEEEKLHGPLGEKSPMYEAVYRQVKNQAEEESLVLGAVGEAVHGFSMGSFLPKPAPAPELRPGAQLVTKHGDAEREVGRVVDDTIEATDALGMSWLLKHSGGKPLYLKPRKVSEAEDDDKLRLQRDAEKLQLKERRGGTVTADEEHQMWRAHNEPQGTKRARGEVAGTRAVLEQEYRTKAESWQQAFEGQQAREQMERAEILKITDPVDRNKQLKALGRRAKEENERLKMDIATTLVQARGHFLEGYLSAQNYNLVGKAAGKNEVVSAYEEEMAEDAFLNSVAPVAVPSLIGSTRFWNEGKGAHPEADLGARKRNQAELEKASADSRTVLVTTVGGEEYRVAYPSVPVRRVESLMQEVEARKKAITSGGDGGVGAPSAAVRDFLRQAGVPEASHIQSMSLVGTVKDVEDVKARIQAEVAAADVKFYKSVEHIPMSAEMRERLRFKAISEAMYKVPRGVKEMMSKGEYWGGKLPGVGGGVSIAMSYATDIASIAQRVQRGDEDVSGPEMAKLHEALIEMRRPNSWLAMVADGALETTVIGIELYASGGVGTVARKAGTEGAERLVRAGFGVLVEKGSREALEATLLRRMASGTAKLVKQTAVGTGSRVFRLAHERATFEGLHIHQSEDGHYYAELDAGHEPGSIWEKLPGAFVHQFIENGSEHAGKLFKGLSAPAQEALAKQAIFQAIAPKAGVKRAMRFLSRGNDRLEKMQVHGLGGELFEEYVAVAGHTVFEGEPFVLPTSREITSMMASLLLVRGAHGMGGMAFGGEESETAEGASGRERVGAGSAGGAGVQAPGADGVGGMDVATAVGEVAPGASTPEAAGVSGADGVHQEQSLADTDVKDSGPQLSFAAADPAANDPVARRAIELGADPRRFRRGKPSRSKDLRQIFADYSLKENEVVLSPNPPKDDTVAQSYLVTHKSGGKAIVNITKDGTVWVDTQEMKDVPRDPVTGLEIPRKEGEKPEPIKGGDLIYQAAMTYAYNNGLKFRSDPSGTTDIAKYRRISHMLSSALRHGTTRHLTPYGKKKKDNDLVANEWREEDTPENFEHNVGLMLRAEMKFVQGVLNSSDQETDVKFEELRYDPESDNVLQQVKDEHGTLAGWRRISERDFESIVDRLVARDSGVGPTTLSRALITKSELERHAGGLGGNTYEEIAELHGRGRVPEGTGVGLFRLLGTAETPKQLYYSRGEASGSERVQRTGVTREETAEAEARLKSTAQGRAIYGNVLIVDNRAALDGLQGRPGQQRYHAEDWDIMQDAEGFHDPRDGTVVIFRENVRVLEGETAAQAMARVVVHERVGHHGFDALLESDSKFKEEWKKLAKSIPADQMKKLKERYSHLGDNHEALALEWFAHQVGDVGGRAQLEPGSVAQQMWQAMRDWVVRQLSSFGEPSKPMSQELIDAHVRGLIRATQRSMVKGAKKRSTHESSTAPNSAPGSTIEGERRTLLSERPQFARSNPDDSTSDDPTLDEATLLQRLNGRVSRTDKFTGAGIEKRVALSKDLPDGEYLFVVDESGAMWALPFAARLKHNSLVKGGEKVKAAGEIVVENGVVDVNARSGHFYQFEPLLGDEIQTFEKFIKLKIEKSGLKPGNISSDHVN